MTDLDTPVTSTAGGNLGRVDRLVRAAIALGLLVGAVVVGMGTFDAFMLTLISIPIAVTAVRGQCWLYGWYGVSTSRRPEGIVCDTDRCRLR